MACSKYTLTNTGSTIVNFNYRRCDDSLWQYQVELVPNQTKNIWLIDNTYSIAPSFRNSVVLINEGSFPPVTASNTPTPTPTPTTTNTPTPSNTATNTPTPSNTATNTPTPSNTATNTPTPTQTQTPTQTETGTPTPTPTPTQTQTPTFSYFTYSLGFGNTASEACNDFVSSPQTVYGQVVDGPGPNVGEILYQTPGNPLTNPVADGYYSNGTAWYIISGGLGEITASDPNGCVGLPTATPTPTPTNTPTNTGTPVETPTNTPTNTQTGTPTQTPTPTANRFSFTVYSGTTSDESCGQYFPSITIYGEEPIFDDNTIFYDTIAGPSIGSLTGYFNNSQIVVELSNGSETGGFVACQTLTPTPTQTQTQTPTQTQTGTPTQTPTQTGTPTQTPTQTGTPTQTPTPTANRFAFTVYTGTTYDESCGQYFPSVIIYGEEAIFDENNVFYNTIVGPSTENLNGFFNNSQIVVELNNGTQTGGFSACQTLTPTPTQTQTQTQTPTPTQTQTQTPTNTPSPTPTFAYYTYSLGTGATEGDSCTNFGTPTTIYGTVAGGPGPNIGETLYLTAGIPPTNPVPNGWYSNGTATFEVTGGSGVVSSANPTGCS